MFQHQNKFPICFKDTDAILAKLFPTPSGRKQNPKRQEIENMPAALGEMHIENLNYARDAVPNKTGGRSVYVSTSNTTDNKLCFMFSETKVNPMSNDDVNILTSAPFGVSEPMAGGSTTRLSMDVHITTPTLLQKLQEIDKLNIDAAVANSNVWFKKDLTSEQLKDLYSPIAKIPENEKYKPTMRVKIQTEGRMATNIMIAHACNDEEEGEESSKFLYKQGTIQDINQRSKLLMICETTGLWFQAKAFGMSLNATEIIVFNNQERKRGMDAFDFEMGVKCMRAE